MSQSHPWEVGPGTGKYLVDRRAISKDGHLESKWQKGRVVGSVEHMTLDVGV